MGLEFYRSASRRVSNRVGATFVKTNGKCQSKVKNADFGEKSASFADFNIYDMRQYCIIIYVRHE